MSKRVLSCFCLCILLSANAIAQTLVNFTIAPWKDNKKAAASITLDDAIEGQFTIAAPLLKKYSMPATFFITTRIMQQQGITWQMLNNAAANGNEIANHTLTHPYLRRLPVDSIAYEVDGCNKLIDSNVPAQKCITLAYPFGDGGNPTDSEAIVMKAVQPFCIGARATRNNKLAYNPYAFATGNNAYYTINSDMIADSASAAGLPVQLDETIAAGGWYVPTYHGIENGWIITKAAVFEQHLQAFAKRKDVLWIATFAEVIKYHKERNCAKINITAEDKYNITLALTDTLTNTAIWNEPLTLNLQQTEFKVKSITQGGKNIPFTIADDVATFNVMPGNEIIIRKKITALE